MGHNGQRRKLSTIVALDVAGYAALTEADEARTASKIAGLRGVIERVARRHGGRVFNTAGDGFMLEFESIHSAVDAALELAKTCKPSVRVGVHVGDVFVQPNGDLLGHGVNVAARLMAKAAPAEVLVSSAVKQTIRGRSAERLQSRGTIKLDKMKAEIEAFAWSPVDVAATKSRAPVPELKRLVGRYARVLAAHKGPECIVGQSQVIELGYSSPVLELPHDLKTKSREDAFIQTMQRLPQLRGKDCRKVYRRWRNELSSVFRNDPNVMLRKPLKSLSEVAKAYPCDFSIAVGLKEHFGWRPWGVTGNVLAVTPNGQSVLLLNRAKRVSRDAPEQLHVIGGAMDPYFDLGSIARCAEREFHEEAGKHCNVLGSPALLQRESEFRHSMITFLGVSVQYSGRHETEEGTVYPLDLANVDEVVNCFLNEPWVDSGRQAFLVWLRLGCPVHGKTSPSISAGHARELYDRCLEICREKKLLRPWGRIARA